MSSSIVEYSTIYTGSITPTKSKYHLHCTSLSPWHSQDERTSSSILLFTSHIQIHIHFHLVYFDSIQFNSFVVVVVIVYHCTIILLLIVVRWYINLTNGMEYAIDNDSSIVGWIIDHQCTYVLYMSSSSSHLVALSPPSFYYQVDYRTTKARWTDGYGLLARLANEIKFYLPLLSVRSSTPLPPLAKMDLLFTIRYFQWVVCLFKIATRCRRRSSPKSNQTFNLFRCTVRRCCLANTPLSASVIPLFLFRWTYTIMDGCVCVCVKYRYNGKYNSWL